jgi:hypothetical protein
MTAFSNDDLNELEGVLASVCETLAPQDEEVKARIRRRLFLLASNGISKPRQLHDHLIRSFTRAR